MFKANLLAIVSFLFLLTASLWPTISWAQAVVPATNHQLYGSFIVGPWPTLPPLGPWPTIPPSWSPIGNPQPPHPVYPTPYPTYCPTGPTGPVTIVPGPVSVSGTHCPDGYHTVTIACTANYPNPSCQTYCAPNAAVPQIPVQPVYHPSPFSNFLNEIRSAISRNS